MEKLRYRAGKGFFKAMAKTQDSEIETLLSLPAHQADFFRNTAVVQKEY